MSDIIKLNPIQGIEQGSGGEVIFTSGIVLPPATTISLTSNQNNLVVTGLSSGVLLRIYNLGNNDLTGVVPPDITQGNLLFLSNVGRNTVRIKDNDANSTNQNRFLCGGSKNLQSNESMIFVYDTISLRWRSFAVII